MYQTKTMAILEDSLGVSMTYAVPGTLKDGSNGMGMRYACKREV